MNKHCYIIILAAILIAGAIVRGLYLFDIMDNPDFNYPPVDAGYHDYWARSLVTGNWTPPPGYADPEIYKTPYLRPPGYPYFLAMVYLLTNMSYTGIRILQMFLGLLNCVLAWRLGRSVFGEREGVILAALMAFNWVLIYFEGELLEPVVLVTLELLAINQAGSMIRQITWRNALLTGVFLGLFALVRPNILLFVPVLIMWTLIMCRCAWQKKGFTTAMAGIILGIILTISPTAVRNYKVSGEFVPVSSNFGINLFLGNCSSSDGLFVAASEVGTFGDCYDYPGVIRRLERKLGRPLTHSQVSSYYVGQAVNYIVDHPAETVKLTLRKALLLWGPREVSHNKEEELERENSWVLKHLPRSFALVLAFFIIGAVLAVNDSRHKRVVAENTVPEIKEQHLYISLILLFIVTYSASFLPFFVAAQYRAPLIPCLLLFVSYAVCRIFDQFRAKEIRKASYAVAAVVVLFCVASRNYTGYQPDKANWHYLRGVAYERDGRLDAAKAEYQASLKLEPEKVELHNNLGTVLARQGKMTEAVKHYSVALKLDPSYIKSLNNLGVILDEQGRTDEAIRVYKAVLKTAPDNAATHNNLAVSFYLKGRYTDAWSEVKLCRSYGGNPSSRLLEALSKKMPEP